ncbi:hypothetical protein HU200_066347 [Digitaria exilis]|uniref:Uncharacterized protein n=1 Tax=Digitaria exilis TaxID=1010633 RepID=A0A834ZX79_9POAL|nr:hypothetical protein HU200_066347 [Digitaria exilis]
MMRKTSSCSFWRPLLVCKSAQKPGQQCSRYIKHSQTETAQHPS